MKEKTDRYTVDRKLTNPLRGNGVAMTKGRSRFQPHSQHGQLDNEETKRKGRLGGWIPVLQAWQSCAHHPTSWMDVIPVIILCMKVRVHLGALFLIWLALVFWPSVPKTKKKKTNIYGRYGSRLSKIWIPSTQKNSIFVYTSDKGSEKMIYNFSWPLVLVCGPWWR